MNLDLRQRAMLQEMGITVWLPQSAAAALAAEEVLQQAAVATAQETARANTPALAPMSSVAVERTPANVVPPSTAQQSEPAVHAAAPAAAVPAKAWRMAQPVQAFSQAQGGAADDAWLVIWEPANPATPFDGDSGKLLHNMLRALCLHRSAHVWLAAIQRPGSEALPTGGQPEQTLVWQELPHALQAGVQQIRPARILVLGLHAARAVLGKEEALGALRAQAHALHHIPVAVSYDPAYLLRAPHAKPAAWADLCHAHALRPPSER